MPPRLSRTHSRLGDVLLYADTDRPIPLHLDTKRKNARGQGDFAITEKWIPTAPGDPGGIQLNEWLWQNGPGGAGTSIETPTSYEQGACAYGENAWLRRIGVAQPAGALTELQLPPLTDVTADGIFIRGQIFGATNDLYITTAYRTIVKVPGGTGLTALTEQDCGLGAQTVGIAIFNGTGSSRLYVGDTQNGIWEYDGAAWTEGAAGTEGGWLEVPYWVLGDQLATGGAASSAGSGGHRLVVSNPTGTGFRHVAGDPQVDANYSALTTVGVGGTVFGFKKTVASNRTVWFTTALGVHGVDALGYSPNLLKGVELYGGVNTGHVAAYWAGMLWFGTTQGLIAFRPDGSRVDIPTFVQFGSKAGVTPIYGLPTALGTSEDGLYVAYYDGQAQTAYVGCLLLDGGSFRWSMAEAVLPDRYVTYLQQVVGSDDKPRLFIGAIDGARLLHLYTQSLPISGDPETDYRHGGPFVPAASWSLTLSRFDGGRPVLKTARRWMLQADQLGESYPDNQVLFQVANDGGAAATQGTASLAAVDHGRWSAQPAVNTTQATSLQVKLAVENATTAPVVIRAASVLYSSHPEQSKVVTFPAIIGEGRPGEDPRQVLQRVQVAMRAGPIAIDDYFGRRIEGTVSLDNTRIVPEASGNGFTAYADVTILYTRQALMVSEGDTVDDGYLVS